MTTTQIGQGPTSAAQEKPKEATVKIQLADILNSAIAGLQVEIRCAEKLWFKGMTSAEGLIEFQAAQGRDLVVSVKKWLTGELKPVARFFTGKDEIDLKLISPKVKTKIDAQAKAAGGTYVRGTYKVRAGDTLGAIAKKCGVSVDLLSQMNGIKNINKIAVGQVLKVPPVEQRTKEVQPAAAPKKMAPILPATSAPAPAGQPASSASPLAPLANPPSVAVPQPVQTANTNGNPISVIAAPQPAIIFPLVKKPRNQAGGEFPLKDWTKAYGENSTCFGRPRGNGRRHAGRDLYAEDFAEVRAIAPGEVLLVRAFYMRTDAITIKHKASDGREFIVRYGEVDPESVTVKKGDVVQQGQIIGKTGILYNANGTKLGIIGNINISMLHFELFTGAAGLTQADNLSNTNNPPYQRRSDLVDSLELLQEGYINSFKEGVDTISAPIGNRKSPSTLKLSEMGANFIKDYEKLRLDYYEDHLGYCTVGWGHLTGGKKSCSSQGIEVGAKIALAQATEYFDDDAFVHQSIVKQCITAPLYQHEFDALVSLAFNIGWLNAKAPNLCKLINEQRYTEGAKEFLDITNGGNSGLVKRRSQENAMFLKANYDSTH